MGADGSGHRPAPDPGRQAERTTLAHWRTELSAVAVAALIVRQAGAGAERIVVAVLGGLAAVTMVAAGWVRQRRLARPEPHAAPRVVALTVAGVLTLQALALVIAV